MTRRFGVALAALCLCTEVAALTRYQCRLLDGSTRQVGQDIARRFPALVKDCVPIEVEELDEPDRFFLLPRGSSGPVRVISAPEGRPPRALPQGLWAIIDSAAGRHGVDPRLVQAVIQVESAYAVHARSPKGALGLMQLMPATAARFGASSVQDLFDPAVNIDVGVRYLRALATQFGNRIELVLAAYNAGEGAVVRHGYEVPPYRETREYVRKVLELYPGG